MDLSGMDRDREADGAESGNPEKKLGKGGWGRSVGIVLILLTSAVALLPRLLSTSGGRAVLLARINARLTPAKLEADDWTLRWFSPVKIEGLFFQNPVRGVSARVETITVSHGLLRLLPFGRLNAGEVTVKRPAIQLELPLRARDPSKPPPKKPPSPQASARKLPIRDLALRLNVVDGHVEGMTRDAGSLHVAHLQARMEISSLNDPVPVKIGFELPMDRAAGRVEMDGRVQSPAFFIFGGEAAPEKLVGTVGDLDLRALHPLLRAFSGHSWIKSGIADGRMALTLPGSGAAEVDAEVTVRRLSLTPPGRSDTPVGDLILRADLTRHAQDVAIRAFSLTSPWIGAAARGQLNMGSGGSPPLGRMQAKADVNLVALARDFGPLLNLADPLQVERGRLTADVEVEATAEARMARVAIATSDLSVRLGHETVNIAPAPTLRAHVRQAAGEPPEIAELAVKLPFARLEGKGRLDAASLIGRLDLTVFSRDFRRLLKVCPPMVGEVEWRAETRREGERVRVRSTLTATDLVADFAVARFAPHPARMVLQKGALTFEGFVPLRAGAPAPEIEDAVWSLSADGCRANGGWSRLTLPYKGRKPALRGFKANLEADLAAAMRIARPWLPLPPGATLAGQCIVHATAEVADREIKARFNSAARGMALTTTGWDIRDPDMRAEAMVAFDMSKREMNVTDGKLSALPFKVDVPSWQMRLPGGDRKNGAAPRGQASGTLDLGRLTAWQRPPRNPSVARPAVRGRTSFALRAAPAADGGARMDADMTVEDFAVSTPGAALFEEKRAEIKVAALLASDGTSLALDSVRIKSALGDMAFSGKIDALRKEKRCVINGTIAVDMEAVTSLLQARGLKGARLTGRQARPFELQGNLGNRLPALLSFGRSRGAVFVGGIEWLGLKAGPSDFSFNLEEGVADLSYEPALGGGVLRFKPSMQVAVRPMVLNMPRESKLLDNVPLTQELADELLGRVNPLLRRCVALSGRIDLIVSECHIPLGAAIKKESALSARIVLRDVRLMPTGPLSELIALAGMEQQAIGVSRYTIRAEVRDGRVRPEPITLTIGDTPVVFSGSVGLDGSIAYAADVPLSEGLVGREGWKYLQGERIRVQVTGTLNDVRLDSEAARAEIQRLARRALERVAVDTLGGILDQLRNDVDTEREAPSGGLGQ